jgi:hypothetical protein
MALPGSQTNPNLTAARFLLKPGRKYDQAVEAFEPYNETKEINQEARAAGAALIEAGKKNPKRKTFIFVNNRLYAARGIKPVMPPPTLCRAAIWISAVSTRTL